MELALYDDAMMEEESEMPQETTEEETSPEENEAPTTVIPRSVFEAAGKTPEPGSVCKFRVIAAHDDSIEVEYEKDESDEEELAEAPVPQSEMAEMMS